MGTGKPQKSASNVANGLCVERRSVPARPERDSVTDIPQDPTSAHEAAGPDEALPEIQAEVREHSPEDQVQPPDADDEELYGSP